MKRAVIFFILLSNAYMIIYAFDGEFATKSDVAITKSFVSDSVEINLYAGEKWYGDVLAFSLYPRLRYKNDKVRLGFESLTFGINLESFSFNIGKKGVKYGTGYYSDVFSPIYPSAITDESKIWSIELLYSLPFLEISVGGLCDTNSLEEYNTPLWFDIFALLKYQNDSLEFSLETDYFYSGNNVVVENYKLSNYKQKVDKHDLKTSLQFLYLFKEDYQIYLQAYVFYNGKHTIWDWNNIGVVAGIFKNFLFQGGYQITPYVELGYGQSIINTCIGLSVILSYNTEVKFSVLYVQNSSVYTKLDVRSETDFFVFETEFLSPNLLLVGTSPMVLTLRFSIKIGQ